MADFFKFNLALHFGGSKSADDPSIIQKFISNPDFPWLISFPRTGSHWLRMIMELYFEKPSLVRIFYFKNAKEFTCYHRHDEDLGVQNIRRVVYLYRNPVDTVYSQLCYYGEDINDLSRIKHWSDLYGRHLSKWLFEENFSIEKTVLSYEDLKKNIDEEFKKVCNFFKEPFDEEKFKEIFKKISKNELKKKTGHDKQVVNTSTAYQLQRETFRVEHGNTIMKIIAEKNERLKGLF